MYEHWTLVAFEHGKYTYKCNNCGFICTNSVPPEIMPNVICDCQPVKPKEPEPIDVKGIMANANFPPSLLTDSPQNRDLANKIYAYREHNIIVTGDTGTGKTTAMLATAKHLVEKYGTTFYYYPSLTHIINEYRKKKLGEIDTTKFFRNHQKYDILIIDECLADTNPNLCKELLFELVDSLYRGNSRTKLWLAGNFYADCFSQIFPDPAPFYRRLKSCFRGFATTSDTTAKLITIGD